MKKIVFMGFLLLLGLSTALGQTVRISGVVTDAADGSTLPGATVQVKGTTQGTTTDLDGRYELSADANATLVFSFVGMENKEEAVRGRTTINVALESEIKSLGEFVVVGYGTARQVGNVVGNVTTVSSQKLESRPVANVMDALQGQVAGMQVYTSSGEPSQTQSMRIHGVGSLSSSSTPLYIVDGAPLAPGSVLSLNPNDIESVVVLKDASATSIYGARAANGVIFYTTKRGRRDEKAVVSVNAQYGVSSLANTSVFDKFMTRDELSKFVIDIGTYTQQNLDNILEQYPHDFTWYKYFYSEAAPTYQADMSVRGGGGRTTYFVSGSYFNQEGLAYRSGYERFTARTNLLSNANDWLEIAANIGFSQDARQTNGWMGNNAYGGTGYRRQPWYSPFDEDGNEYLVIPGLNLYGSKYVADMQPNVGKNSQLNFMTYAQLNPINGLTIKTQFGADAYDFRRSNFRYPSAVFGLNNGVVTEYFSRGITLNFINSAEYKFNIKRSNEFVILAGQEYVDHKWDYFESTGQGLTDDRLMLLSATSTNTRNVNQGKTEYAFLSYFGRLEYSYESKYFLDFSSRMDASSRFGRDERNAIFFSGGFLWNAKRESFMQNVDAISSLRFRANAGTSGNSEIGNYQHQALMGTTGAYTGNVGWLISSPGNSSLTWEKQFKSTVGLELGLFKERFNIGVAFYERKNSSMLLAVPQPFTTGFSSITENIGDLENRGVDIELRGEVLKTRDFSFTSRFVFNYNRDKVTKLYQDQEYWINPGTAVTWVLGQPVAFFFPLFAGIDPDDGQAMWYLPGEDRTIETRDPDKVTKVHNWDNLEQYSGLNRYAPIAGGFGFDVTFKGFDLSANFAFVLGKYMLNNDKFFYENPRQFSSLNMSRDLIDNYWKEPGDVAKYPAANTQLWVQFDDRMIENASFMRLKDLRIGYSIPKSVLDRTNFFNNARFYVSARNLFTFTNYTGPDPEVDTNVSLGAYPNTKQVTMGINLTF